MLTFVDDDQLMMLLMSVIQRTSYNLTLLRKDLML
jgi:hypothetical protein